MGIRKRITELSFCKIGTDFEMMGTGFTNLTEKPSPKTTSKQYINEASATQNITSYEWSTDFEADQIENDKVIEDFVAIGKEQKTGADAEREYIIVDLDRESNTSGSYYARKFLVAVKVDEFANNDGELAVSGSLMAKGDPVIGAFDKATKTFTEGFTPKTT
ncbi:MAG: hypothetical protein ACI4WU_04760 [Bacilli bacterium]